MTAHQSAPSSCVSPAQTNVLLALLRVHSRTGRVTIPALLAETGLASKSTIHHHLHRLRKHGLVTWDEDRRGTLRPLVEVVR